jgi:Zn-dependent protease
MEMFNLFFYFFIVIPSAIIHEFSHAWMAYFLGDDTAKRAGRLTINPLVHLDFFGTILLPFFLLFISRGQFLFAYAKPVPFNPYNLKNQRIGQALVGAAGPISNLLVAIIFGLLIRFLPASNFTSFLSLVVYANLVLMVFNLIPVPPLDGSRILYSILPENLIFLLEEYSFLILLLFLLFAYQLIIPIIFLIYKLIVGSPFLF